VEADAALRDVFALDDFVRVSRAAHAGAETHANSKVAPLVDRPSVCIKLSRGGVSRPAGGAVIGSGACRTALALATAGEVSTSAIKANSEVTDAAEDQAGAAVAGAAPTSGGAAASAGSRVRAKEGSGNAKSGFARCGAGLGRDELKRGLGGLAGEARENLPGVESEDAANEGTDGSKDLSSGGAAKAGSPASWTFRHGVDVPQLSQ
jgi:hypothetical protein